MQNVKIVLLSVICVFAIATAKPQGSLGGLITAKDGNVGLRLGNLHAEAGLGGLLTGNPAAGGLHVGAGIIPNGANAQPGLSIGSLLARGGSIVGQHVADPARLGAEGAKALAAPVSGIHLPAPKTTDNISQGLSPIA